MKQSIKPGDTDRITAFSDPDDISPYLSGDRKKVVLFAMSTCPYCHMFEERFRDFAQSRSTDYDFLRVIIDDPGNPLWSRYEIHVVPQILVFANGQV
ncbi:MAG: thioredoxin family protein, partial [Candidatus Aminicenantes bacterium]|nr:thioredoxin family protein [Candidatus Aminicenantes bacterium]